MIYIIQELSLLSVKLPRSGVFVILSLQVLSETHSAQLHLSLTDTDTYFKVVTTTKSICDKTL